MEKKNSESLYRYAMRSGKIMAVDFGTKRTGVAFLDPQLITEPLTHTYRDRVWTKFDLESINILLSLIWNQLIF